MPNSPAASFRLYLVRHAHAAWGLPGVGDFDRPLDDLGRIEARDIARQADLAGFVPDRLVFSPALRCRQTTAALLEVFRTVRPIEDMMLYSDGADAYVTRIRRHAPEGSLMIVGHNPMIEALAQHLAVPGEVTAPLSAGYPTAGLLALDIARPLPSDLAGRGQAVALITPALT